MLLYKINTKILGIIVVLLNWIINLKDFCLISYFERKNYISTLKRKKSQIMEGRPKIYSLGVYTIVSV